LVRLIPFLLLLSGASALIYQIVWVRLLGLSFGITSMSIGTVLAAFFLGMASGSMLAGYLRHRGGRPLRAFIVAEAMTGVCALLLFPLLLQLDQLMTGLPLLADSLWLKFLVAMAMLFIPSACIGATYPLISLHLIRRQGEIGAQLGRLYSLNVLGAVAGVLLSAFLLIPWAGLDGALYTAVAINLGVAVIAFVMWRSTDEENQVVPLTTEVPKYDARLVPVLAVTGFVTLASEVAWSKYLALLTGATLYGFAVMLAGVLLGMALGAAGANRWLSRHAADRAHLLSGLLLLALSLIITRSLFNMIPSVADALHALPVALGTLIKFGTAVVAVILPSLLLGALFPLSLQLYCGDLMGLNRRLGAAYAINTLAGVVGALAAGLWLIPQIGTDDLLRLLAGMVLLLTLTIPAELVLNRIRLLAVGTGVVALLLLPGVDYSSMVASVHYRYRGVEQETPGEVIYVEEGRSGVISLARYGTDRVDLQKNGIKEAMLNRRDPRQGTLAEMLLAVLPYLMQSEAESAFVVGFGVGTTPRMLAATDLQHIKVVELEPAVLRAMGSLGGDVVGFLDDPRIELEINDARNSLLLSHRRYDLIVSQPSHPWLEGSANLFTREFFEIGRKRLNPSGVFGQWVNLFNMDVETLGSIFAAFYQVFPRGVVFALPRSGDLLLFGSDQALSLDYQRTASLLSQDQVQHALGSAGVKRPGDILRYFLFTRAEALKVAADAEANSDLNLISEARLAALYLGVRQGEAPMTLLERWRQRNFEQYR